MRKDVAFSIIIAIALCAFLAFSAWYLDGQTANLRGYIITGAVLCGVLLWMFLRRERRSDVLGSLGMSIFERQGLCFAIAPISVEQSHKFTVIYQNRYGGACRANFIFRPVTDLQEFKAQYLSVTCEGGGGGVGEIAWLFPPSLAGCAVRFWIGASVQYPEGRGKLVRLRGGLAVGSVAEVESGTWGDPLVNCTHFKLTLPRSEGEFKFKVTEDVRSFQEFYPDAELRHKVHYGFAHRFLPQYVHEDPVAFFSYLFRHDMPGGAMEPTRFIQSRWLSFEEQVELVARESDIFKEGMKFRRVSDLSMSLHEAGGRACALVQMPGPERPAEAFYVGIVLLAPVSEAAMWSQEVQARVFTLEAMGAEPSGLGPAGVLCEWTKDGQHRNYGAIVPFEAAEFLSKVTSLLVGASSPRAVVTFARDGSGGSAIRHCW